MSRHAVCIVGLKCYDLLTGASVPRYLGGIEKLLVTLAKGLTRDGVDTAFITYDHGQSEVEHIDGITVYKAFSPEKGLPGLRFVHPRMTALWRAMRHADADLYLQMGAGSETGQVALGCRYFTKSRKPFVFFLASDKDADREAVSHFPLRERMLYEYGLDSADLLISQTETQRRTLLGSFGHSSAVQPMPIESPEAVDIEPKAEHEQRGHHVLWVGRIIESKRLELLFKVAKRCPQVEFDVVGTPNRESNYFDDLASEADGIANVTLHGRVAEGVLPRLYRESTLLLCTSVLEGFPTTFLEAWSYATPVVTTFDPDAVVKDNDLGAVVETEDEIVEVIRRFTEDQALRQEYGAKVRRYFEESYTLGAILPKIRSRLDEVVSGAV